MTDILDELKSRILALNVAKNEYAQLRLKSTDNPVEKKELISSLIYVISELRQRANDLGINDRGCYEVSSSQLEEFKYLNESVVNLKKQILFLTEADSDQVREEFSRQSDQQHLVHKKEKEEERRDKEKGKSEQTRREEVRQRLIQKLQEKKSEEKSEE